MLQEKCSSSILQRTESFTITKLKQRYSRRKPYRRWLEKNRIELKGLFQVPGPVEIDHESLLRRQWIFGYTLEDIKTTLLAMAETASGTSSFDGK